MNNQPIYKTKKSMNLTLILLSEGIQPQVLHTVRHSRKGKTDMINSLWNKWLK